MGGQELQGKGGCFCHDVISPSFLSCDYVKCKRSSKSVRGIPGGVGVVPLGQPIHSGDTIGVKYLFLYFQFKEICYLPSNHFPLSHFGS